ncbi:MarR family transcriptional regulator [Streptomyces sp. NRRL F-4489]|uniref:MarR family winged helix-turn-helix transcriptional regulator n=1 Tax=Streptomyces sp. NRRL F-4489 TaxID=1609095 RepID=UPI00074AF39F|nr:MarR family transcriptional regulator [Streptomyces sp. NRRL F-4489]KUL45982.1 MarR family transcriptional regulator [Streptomyces sp. NRRL F-4489]
MGQYAGRGGEAWGARAGDLRTRAGDADAAGDAQETIEQVTAALESAIRIFVGISARSLAAVDPAPTLPQLRTLVMLHSQGPVKLAALAASLQVSPSTALRMIDKLQATGLVDRRVNPRNRREVVLRLTAAGRHLVERVLARRYEEIGTIVARLPAEERTGLIRALRALSQAADATRTRPAD